MIDFFAMKKVLRAFEIKDAGTIEKAIVEQQINPNDIIPNKGVCLLHLIIGNHSESFAFKITKLFLKCGGDPNVQSLDGVTPTHVAAGWGRNRILHLLLVNGADPWIQDDDKKNAFNYAFEEQKWNTIKMLHHFQKMYSAANCKLDLVNENICLQLEKLFIKKNKETETYSEVKYKNKSIMTENYGLTYDLCASPVQHKIKYFEPQQTFLFNDANFKTDFKSPEHVNCDEYIKSSYQNRNLIILDNSYKSSEISNKKKKTKTFVSSLHVNSFQKKLNNLPGNITDISEKKDVRGQLFVELQEAVRRRSLQKIHQLSPKIKASDKNIGDSSLIEFEKSKSVVILKDLSTSKEVFTDQSDLNVIKTHSLNNISNFGNEILKETENTTINLCSSRSTQGDVSGGEPLKQNGSAPPLSKIQKVFGPQHSLNSSDSYLTPKESTVNSNFTKTKSGEESSIASFMSILNEEGDVVFLEKKLVVTPTISPNFDVEFKIETVEKSHEISDCSSMAVSNSSCDSDVLRRNLLSLGCNVGPITKTTKKLYLNKLKKFKNQRIMMKKSISLNKPTAAANTFANVKNLDEIEKYKSLEEQMCLSFEKWKKRQWREGTNKMSFNYLLLDPRISCNLPNKVHQMTKTEAWKCFLSAIFYVGKGKRSRPFAHLHQAAADWREQKETLNDKNALIIQIWKEGVGVVCLQVFQNTMPVEAFTREAAMIDALGLQNLKNSKKGQFYGVVSTWSSKDKRKLGFYLLYKAYMIFLNEGERQIRPYDI